MNSMTEEITKVVFRMKKDTFRKLKVKAAQNDTSMTNIMNKLIEDFLKEKEKKK